MSKKHNYKSVLAAVRTRLADATYPSGTLLPAENQLAQEFGVSRPTVARAYDQLAAEGLVSKKRGVGTIASQHPVACSPLPTPYTFGLMLPGAGESEIFADINDQIIRQAESIGFSCECEGTTANNAETRSMMALSSMQSYIAKKVDGIFFAPFERVRNIDAVNKAVCDLARQAHIPMVLIDRDIVAPPLRSSFDLVSLDNTTAASLMAHHMIAAGCRNIYFFANRYSAYSVNIRMRAVKNTVIEAGLDFYDQSYICGDPKDMNVVRNIPIIRRQTGIICANDATAAILMSSLAELGYVCGTDYLLSGFDDMKYSSFLTTPLTTYRQPCTEIANVSIDLLMRRIKTPDSHPLTVLLEGEMVERMSTGFKK